MMNALLDKIKENLTKGNTVAIKGFGEFTARKRESFETVVKDNATGERVRRTIPQRVVCYFSPSRKLNKDITRAHRDRSMEEETDE